METKDILHELRTKKGLSQDELAEKLFVTRQAVSRWENGGTTPNVETLKLLSGLFDVSINTLLGSPRQLICQCCGMPLDDTTTSREPDGSFNEDYCKWCYTGGTFTYTSKEQLIDFCVTHMASEQWPAEQVRAHMEAVVPGLKHWKESFSAKNDTATPLPAQKRRQRSFYRTLVYRSVSAASARSRAAKPAPGSSVS